MLTTNLLPSEHKNVIMREIYGRAIRFFACTLILVFLIHSILLLPSYFPQRFVKNELLRSLALEHAAKAGFGVPETEKRLADLQRALTNVKAYTAESGKASLLLKTFFELAEAGVILSTVHIEEDGTVLIAGTASTRRNLLMFEKEMRLSGRFLEVSSPPSNILDETDAQFTIRGTLKQPYRL